VALEHSWRMADDVPTTRGMEAATRSANRVAPAIDQA
jgi:hypothetical protein